MHLNFPKEICPGRSFIPLFLSSNVTKRDKSSVDKEKSAGNKKESKSKDKTTVYREELGNNNSKDLENKSSTDMESLMEEKNMNLDGNIDIQK